MDNYSAMRTALLRRTMAAANGQQNGAVPNSMNTPVPLTPNQSQARVIARPAPAPGVPGMPMQGAAAPTGMPMPGGNPQAMAVQRAAQKAQSPLQFDQGTRDLAKALVTKLIQHM